MRLWMRTAKAVLLATVVAVVLSSCSIYDVKLPGGANVGSDPITVTADFRDVLDLVPQSTVKVDDVTVGRVTKVELKGYTAKVTMLLPHDIDLPDNPEATIRQTSLLGEKFVSLAAPASGGTGHLGNGDNIPLSRTGRNPEVEEVLGALSLLLNGGGVAQLKTIAAELNKATSGRENDVRDVLDQLHEFMGQLNANRQYVVSAIENLDRLARELRSQDGTIKATLDEMPAAIRSIDSQRGDLVKTLQALQNLSGVGVRVIQQSKESTINTLSDLAPVLTKLAEAGSALPKSLQVSLTYPFVDAAVGGSPTIARNLHIGDYVNLNLRLNLDLCKTVTNGTLLNTLKSQLPAQIQPIIAPIVGNAAANALAQQVADAIVAQLKAQGVDLCGNKPTLAVIGQVISQVLAGIPALAGSGIGSAILGAISGALTGGLPSLGSGASGGSGGSGSGGGGGGLGGVLGGLGLGNGSGKGSGNSSNNSGSGGGVLGGLFGNNRSAPSYAGTQASGNPSPQSAASLGYDQTLGTLLLQGVVS